MKINTIIGRYLFYEMLGPFCVNVLFFSFVFLLTQILSITNMIVNYHVDFSTIFWMIIYGMPFFLEFIIPMSVMLTILLTFLKLSSDNEILALKSGGVSLYQLIPPVVSFCLMGAALTGFMAIYALPWGVTSMKQLTLEVVQSNIDIGMKERTFIDYFKNVMIYVNQIDIKDKSLKDVFIEDQRSKNHIITIIAPKGNLYTDKEKAESRLVLFNGMINQVDLESKRVNSVNFETYEMKLDIKRAIQQAEAQASLKDETEMNLTELRDYLKTAPEKDAQYYITLMEFHRKFSIPIACFALGILAVPLGVQSKHARRSFGIILGLGLFLLYYLLLSAGLVFGEAGVYPPLIGMWVPNIVIGGIGMFLFYRVANDRPFAPGLFRLRIFLRKDI